MNYFYDQPNYIPQQGGYRTPTRQFKIDTLMNVVRGSEYVLVDGFECNVTRHICKGGSFIYRLQSQLFPFSMPDGSIQQIEYFKCNVCGKVIINKFTL